MICLGILGKKALVDSQLNAVLMFQIHGHHMSVYVSKFIPGTKIAAMVQIMEMQFPRSVQEVDGFATQDNLDTLVHLYDVFWSNCPCENSCNSPTLSTGFDLATINNIRQSTADRSRPNVLRY
ncbi:hypothetical protein BDC45DRAFT_46507 [Circinella umbellata]|nr:hypothetical protein BDC45DRAFT_46507 [Circinella umbellata]